MSTNKCDVLIIGGGPAGLSAAVNAASEGLKTIICDAANRFGGQAGSSTLIENLVGFPEGISGEELTRRSVTQAGKFNVEFKAPFNTVGLARNPDGGWIAISDEDEMIEARAVLVSIGVTYKALHAKNIARYIGCGVSYGSPSLSENYSDKTICIIGGANSAGQAAVYLAGCSNCNVVLIVRGNSLEAKMSTYLVDKIAEMPNIRVITETEVVEADGYDKLEHITIKNNKTGEEERLDATKLFILIGAKPKTAWLRGVVPLDDAGFIIAGGNTCGMNPEAGRKLLFTEAVDGLFVAGDIRSGSTKRVSSAIGEGSRAVSDIHTYFAFKQAEIAEKA